MEKDLLEIINNYGINNQLRKFNEECFELQEAIINREFHWNYDTEVQDITPLYKHIAEEIADCYVMLEQFRLYYEISEEEIKEIMFKKIDRQLKRIEVENK